MIKTILKKLVTLFTRKNNAVTELPEKEVPPQEYAKYESLISRYLEYFRKLSASNKQRFIHRAWNFRQTKNIRFIGMSGQEEIAILISAAAAQITFGLKNYRLTYFKNIFVMPDAYPIDHPEKLYIGHVSSDERYRGIYISWKHFLQGYADGKDNVNVAIHEMAHALEHHHFMDESDTDHEFRTDFQQIGPVFGPAVAHLVVHKRSYLRSYAFQNLQEFWAVSVEAFFENPNDLRNTMPQLYRVICEILNQDPLTLQ